MNKKKQTSTNKTSSFTDWAILLLLIISLFSKGLFIEGQVLPFSIGIGVILLLRLFYKGITKSGDTSVSYVSIGFLLIAISYLPSFFHAESIEYTLTKIIEWLTYALVLLFVCKANLKSISKVIVLFSMLFGALHYLILFGFLPIEGGVLILGEGLSGSGIRLNGLLQYANATAAVIASLLLYSAQRFIGSKFNIVQYSSLLILSYLLLMTESRGAWLVFAACFLISLALIEQSRQIPYLVHMSVFMIFALATYALTTFFSVGLLVACTILACAIGLSIVMKHFSKKICFNPKSRFVVPIAVPMIVAIAGSVVLNFGLLPTAILNRLTMNTATFSDRIVYMKDGLHAIQDHILFGSGGEAWRFKMYQVQSAPYIVQDMHNFYLQHWLEVGISGVVLVVGLLLFVMIKIGKSKPLLVPPILMLLLHAVIDFTLSYGFVILLLAILLIEGLGEKGFVNLDKPRVKRFINPVVTIVAILCVVLSSIWVQGESAFSQGIEQQDPPSIDRVIKKNPFATRYKLAQYVGSSNTEKVKLMEDALLYEPHHALARFQLAQTQYELGNFEDAFNNFKQSLENDRFDRYKYESAITYLQATPVEDKQLMIKSDKLRSEIERNWRLFKELAEKSPIKDQRKFLND